MGILRAIRQIRTLSVLKLKKKKTIVGEKHFTVSWKISRENRKDFLLLLSICNKLIQTFWTLQKKKSKNKKKSKKTL